MRAVSEDLRLDDWDETVVLADGSVAGKSVGGLTNRDHRWASTTNLENSSPFGEAASFCVEGSGTSTKTVETLSGSLIVCSHNRNESLIELDTGFNSSGAEELNKVCTILGGLIDSLLVHDDARDVFLDRWGSEEKLSVCTSVGLSILNLDGIKALSDGSSALISSQDTFAWSADFLCGSNELFLV